MDAPAQEELSVGRAEVCRGSCTQAELQSLSSWDCLSRQPSPHLPERPPSILFLSMCPLFLRPLDAREGGTGRREGMGGHVLCFDSAEGLYKAAGPRPQTDTVELEPPHLVTGLGALDTDHTWHGHHATHILPRSVVGVLETQDKLGEYSQVWILGPLPGHCICPMVCGSHSRMKRNRRKNTGL